MSLFRTINHSLNKILFKPLHITATCQGKDLREHRLGSVEKKDVVEGERSGINIAKTSFQFITEDLMERQFNGIKFKDIPVMHIISSRNNTKIALIRGNGETMTIKSGGTEGFKNCRKGTTVAAEAVANRILTWARDHEVNMARLVFSGLGPGRNSAFRVFETNKFNIVSLSDRSDAKEPWSRRPRKMKRV